MNLNIGFGTNVDNGIVKYNVNVIPRILDEYALANFVSLYAGCDAIGPSWG